MFYLTLFALTSILFYLAQRSYERSRIVFYALSYAAILLLAFVAGVRDESVGTDIGVYGASTFAKAQAAKSFVEKVEIFGWIDSGYYAINYFAASLGGGLASALFLQSFIMTALVFHGMKTYMSTAPLWLAMLVYDLYFYNLTLNLMRQGVAMAILLWSMRFFETRQFRKLLLSAVLCFFFHKTSILAYLVVFLIYWVAGKDERSQKKFIMWGCVAGVVVVASFTAVLAYLASLSPELARFSAYGGEAGHFKSGVSTLDVLVRGGGLAVILLLSSRGLTTSGLKYTACLFFVMDLAMQFLGLYTYFATRMGYYFFIVEIPLLVSVLNDSKIRRRTLALANVFIVAYFCYYCVRFNFVQGNNETYPYSSEILCY